MANDTPVNEKDFYKHIASSGPGIVAIIKPGDMRMLFVNNAFAHYLGYTQADVSESDLLFSTLIEPYQLSRFEHQLQHIDENFENRSHYVIYSLRNKKGVTASYYLYLSLVEDGEQGNRLCYVLMQPDLSKWGMPFSTFDTKEIFLEHFDSEDFGTFEWLIDVDKVYWSAGIYNIYELDGQHKIDNAFARSFLHPDDVDRVAQNAMENGQNGETNIEFRIITAKGNIKTLHSIAKYVTNDEGKRVKFVGSLRDISRQKEIQDDLKRKVDELNHSNKELEEFAYVASHDMQEPLRKITTFGSRLSEKYKDVLTGDGAMYLSRMTTAAENMRLLITDLLDFSRVAKNMEPFEQVYLNVVLRLVKTELELVIEETGSKINSAQLPVIDAIPSQMKQLFANIISNAIKFHKDGIAPVISITSDELSAEEKNTYRLPEEKTYYKIQVTDNGIGFEDEYAGRIFNVFQRLHGKSEYPGSGIGLAICKKIVEHHNGIIYASGTPGEGAKFVFILPAKQEKNQQQ